MTYRAILAAIAVAASTAWLLVTVVVPANLDLAPAHTIVASLFTAL
jgi:hypothetical protein